MLVDTKTLDGTPVNTLSSGSEKRVELSCNDCGAISITTWSNYIRAQNKHERNGETFCRKCACKKSASKRKGCTWKKKPHQILTGEKHPNWRGGRYISSDGYVMINVKVGRPRDGNGWGNYKKEHVVIVQKILGRKLIGQEQVHHINGIKTDNDVDNLLLVKDSSEHRDIHNSLYQIAYNLIDKKLIHFDHNKKQYVADLKLRELLGYPGEGNQQPSLDGDILEGSETRDESQKG